MKSEILLTRQFGVDNQDDKGPAWCRLQASQKWSEGFDKVVLANAVECICYPDLGMDQTEHKWQISCQEKGDPIATTASTQESPA